MLDNSRLLYLKQLVIKIILNAFFSFDRYFVRPNEELRHIFLRLRRVPANIGAHVLPSGLGQQVGEVSQEATVQWLPESMIEHRLNGKFTALLNSIWVETLVPKP